MPTKKKFLLRLDPAIYGTLERWAADELRSVNGQMEFLLRAALRRAGRLPLPSGTAEGVPDAPPDQKDAGQ
jgi:hypothetical protein